MKQNEKAKKLRLRVFFCHQAEKNRKPLCQTVLDLHEKTYVASLVVCGFQKNHINSIKLSVVIINNGCCWLAMLRNTLCSSTPQRIYATYSKAVQVAVELVLRFNNLNRSIEEWPKKNRDSKNSTRVASPSHCACLYSNEHNIWGQKNETPRPNKFNTHRPLWPLRCNIILSG